MSTESPDLPIAAAHLATAQLAAEQLEAAQLVTAQLSTAQLAAEQLTAAHVIATQLAAEQLNASETAAARLAEAQSVVADQLAAEQLASSHLIAARLAAEQLASAQMTANLIAAEHLTAAKIAAEQLAASVSAAARLAASQLVAAEQLAASQLVVADELAAAALATAALIVAEEESRLVMDSSSIGTALLSPSGQFIRVNPALCRMFERTSDELKIMTWQDLTHPDDLPAGASRFQELQDGRGEGYRLLTRFLGTGKGVVWGDLSVNAVRLDGGAIRYVIAQIVDVSDRVVAERAVAEREEMLRVVLDSSRDSTMRMNRELRIEYVNRRAVEISGIAASDWLGKTFLEVGYPGELSEFWNSRYQRVLDDGLPVRFEFKMLTVDGQRWFECIASAEFAPDETVAHVISTSRDVTERKASDAELLRLATHDSLTGLANRASLLDDIDRALSAGQRSGRPVAVLMIDLDHFKDVNDSLGHGAGDELLVEVASRLRTSARGGDLVGRPGGDEFIIVMRDLQDPAEALRTAWRIVQDFRKPFLIGSLEILTTVSIGVTIASNASTSDDLVREADTAMYLAKSEGRDRVMVFNEDLRATVISRLTLESDLRHALERGELVVWYQPEVDLATGSIMAVEALIRWNHPSGELYAADRFIQIAEDTGMIVEIGAWVLSQACAQAVTWEYERPEHPLMMRVNMSAVQLAEDDLLASVDGALNSSAINPARLCIEITETALLRDTVTVHSNLMGLRDRGIQIAIDDFGTGYASLTYLRRYPIDVIKIDRSFIDHIATDKFTHQLVAGIVAFARHLNMTVTAEGVETVAQARLLRDLACPGAQGYLYSKAIPPEDLRPLLQHGFSRAELE